MHKTKICLEYIDKLYEDVKTNRLTIQVCMSSFHTENLMMSIIIV